MFDNIAIIGQGFVGSAVREGLRRAFKVITYDIKYPDVLMVYEKEENSQIALDQDKPLVRLLEATTGPIFLCLPTPMNKDGSCNIGIIEEQVKEISLRSTDRVIVIKSTIVPGTTDYLNKTYPAINVCFNPEFLRERSAIEDFKNQDRVIIGGPHKATEAVKQIYQIAFPSVPITKTAASVAEMVKYITNCFLATKVSFANEIKQICDKIDIDYDRVIEIATKDTRLGTSHWQCPGNDGTGKKGWGLTCFPKDLNALMFLAKERGVDPRVMRATWEKNLEVRPERDWENLIGRAVV